MWSGMTRRLTIMRERTAKQTWCEANVVREANMVRASAPHMSWHIKKHRERRNSKIRGAGARMTDAF